MDNSITFSETVSILDEKIKSYYKQFELDGKKPIGDGIINTAEYYNSPIKILWILKEPYDLDNDGEGGWSMNELLNDEKNLNTLGGLKTTWYPIIYTSYAILNGFKKYDDLEFIDKDLTMLNVLKKVAIINVQKFAANTSTNNNDITAAYKEHSKILLEQINTYNPHIIIGANTLSNFIDDLNLKEYYKYDEYDYWIKDNKLYINAGHPAVRGGYESKEAYVDDIVRIAKRFYENRSN